MDSVARPYTTLLDDVMPVIGRACETLAAELQAAQAEMQSAMSMAAGIGLPNRLILGLLGYGANTGHSHTTQQSTHAGYWVRYGRWQVVAMFLTERRVTASYLQPIVDQAALAFKTAREARLAFVQTVGAAREDLARLLYGEPTAQEQAVDRAVAAGDEGDSATYIQGRLTDTDPEGRVLLYRWRNPYDTPAVFYRDGSPWSDYLKGNEMLSRELRGVMNNVAVEAVRSGGAPYDMRGNMSIENGYGTGYEQLHGTEATVGDFHIEGKPTVLPLPGGGHKVVLETTYTWNDVIDPNASYLSDWVASRLQPGKPYDMHIEWQERTTVILDPAGRPVAMHGYPARNPAP
jgi:hypothetical protein